MIISELAQDAFQATIQTFISVVSENIRAHGNVLYVHAACGDSYPQCANSVIKTFISLQTITDPLKIKNYKGADILIDNIFQAERKTATRETVAAVNYVLHYLVQLGKKYCEINILAEKLEAGEPVRQKLLEANTALHILTGDLETISRAFPEAFKPLLERHHTADIGPEIEKLRGETKIRQAVNAT